MDIGTPPPGDPNLYVPSNEAFVDPPGSYWYDVYAGYVTANPTVGVVVLISVPKDPCMAQAAVNPGGTYKDPVDDGALSLISANDTTLVLRAASSGRTLTFNLSTRLFT
jgi:hypothetical protein